jgi:aminoglycoside phosphotransferase family enzyme/predicted kinase
MTAATSDQHPPYLAVHETHVGVVFLIGDRAYKLKKPVDMGFLDFRTESARAEVCRREVALNQRLAPDVYLGVADVAGPDGRPCDHLVVMRRMPGERRLSTLLHDRAPIENELRHIAHVIAAFHSRCESTAQIAAEGSRDALLARWAASFDQARPFHGNVLDGALATEIERLTLRFLAGRRPLFDARIRDGYIVDGHGDLIADDIFCLPDGPRILDCLEFDDRLRYLDRLDDAAFLAMDIEHHGAPELAERFLGWYGEFTADPAPPGLLHHYLAYRAFVRAKVACLRQAQGDPDAAAQARAFSAITHRHLATAVVKLILVGGLPGTGKSTLAGGLADRLGLTLLSSDRVRKELAGIDPTASAAAEYQSGIYSPEWTEHTYAELLNRAERMLGLGESVVLDASWNEHSPRNAAAEIAARTHSDLIQLRCEAPFDLVSARIRDRRGISDADDWIALDMLADAEPWPASVMVDSTLSPESALGSALAEVQPHPAQEQPWPLRRPVMSPD